MKGQKSITVEKLNKPTAIDESVDEKQERVKRNAYAERRLAFDEGLISDEFVQEFKNIENEYNREIGEIKVHTAKKFVDKALEILGKTGMAHGRIKNIVIAYGCDLGWNVETIGHQWPENYKDPKKKAAGKIRAKQRHFAKKQKEDPEGLAEDARKGGDTRAGIKRDKSGNVIEIKNSDDMQKIGMISVRSRTTAADMETLVHQTTVYCPFDIVFRENELKQMVDKKEVWVRILDHDRYDILRAIPA